MLAKAGEIVKSLQANGTLPDGISFGDVQTWIYAENKDPHLNNIIFAMDKPTKGASYQVSNADNGDVVIIALEAVEDGKVSEQQRLQADSEISRAQQIDMENNLLKSLRARAKIEVNQDIITQ